MAQKKGVIAEFQEFISRGNVMDMAVGVIVGGAFTAVVTALTTNIIQPIISIFTGGTEEIEGLAIKISGQIIDFGAFISAIITFLITAVAVFAIVKAMNKMNELKDLAAEKAGLARAEAEAAAPAPRTCPYCKQEIADDATRCPHCTAKLEGYENPRE